MAGPQWKGGGTDPGTPTVPHQSAEGIPTVNEFLILLESAAGIGWLTLVAVAVAAVAMLVFDRRPSRSAKAEREARERMAA